MKTVSRSTITCPHCSYQKIETMPTNACLYFYICENCKISLKPKLGNCCVFCSYGDVPCPPIQKKRAIDIDSD
ncbi:GDCCVxC domain-containing (seleno)protein [Candidatus Nitrosacidococcus tergens]|uniref:GDCCVxC domain-containing (seleno)protein n=1 Tax=Candidatus Nitrosacidococcus tergens TaxID=553981 RepID=UPI0018D6F7AD|nr:GDCCVxC domain-containing (seleno)protein [Candidatus Nitrosacidococcus tergens]